MESWYEGGGASKSALSSSSRRFTGCGVGIALGVMGCDDDEDEARVDKPSGAWPLKVMFDMAYTSRGSGGPSGFSGWLIAAVLQIGAGTLNGVAWVTGAGPTARGSGRTMVMR